MNIAFLLHSRRKTLWLRVREGQTMLACLMVECMAASSRWLKVREGARGGGGGGRRGREWEREVCNRTDVNYRDGRRAGSREKRERKTPGWMDGSDRDVRERVKALMGGSFGADDNWAHGLSLERRIPRALTRLHVCVCVAALWRLNPCRFYSEG